MQKKIKLPLRETIFVFVCLLCSAFSIERFWNALNATLSKNETPIATISFKYKTAQRKFLNDLIWDRLRQESPVYEGDTIRTAPLSEAKVTFLGDNENVLDLQENTMVRISLKGEKPEINIAGGQVSVQTGRIVGVTIINGEAVVDVEADSQIEAAGLDGGVLNVALQKGNASLTALEGKVSLEQGKSTDVSSGGAVARKHLSVQSPSLNQKFLNFTEDDFSVPFKWDCDSEKVVLELSDSKNFSKIAYSKEFSDLSEGDANIPSGTWYWRLTTQADSANGFPSERASGKFSVLYSPAPTLIAPKQDFSVSFRHKKPSIRFSWTQAERASSYEIKIADNPAMENPVIQQRQVNTSCIISSMNEGTWYWTVTPYYVMNKIGLALPSKTGVFKITKDAELLPPTLISPSDSSVVSTKVQTRGKSTFKKINFSWKDDPESELYEFKLWNRGSQGNPLVHWSGKVNYFTLNPANYEMPNDNYYWQVTMTDSEGNYTQSEIREFYAIDADLEQRTLFPPDNYHVAATRTMDLRYSWKTNIPTASILQIARDEKFNNIVFSQETTNSSINGRNLADGTYFWRISASIGDVTLNTQPKTLMVEPPMEAPENIVPYNNGRAIVRPNTPFEFRWKTVEGADYYQFKIAKLNDPDTILFEQNFIEPASASTVSLKVDLENFEETNYIWIIQGHREESTLYSRASGYSSEHAFQLKQLKPITLTFPAQGETIDGAQAVRNPGNFGWASVDTPAETELVIYRDFIDDANLVASIKNPSEVQKMPVLYEGTYYWKVLGRTYDDLDISSVENRSLIITAIPKLSAPQMIQPPANNDFNAAYFKNNRIINFKWGKVTNADRYILSILAEDGRVLFTKQFDKNTTEYKFDDLTKLEVGNLRWTLEAQSEYNGVLFQRGEVRPSLLKINLPSLKKPTVTDTGTRYGN